METANKELIREQVIKKMKDYKDLEDEKPLPKPFAKVDSEADFIAVLKRYYKGWVRHGGSPYYYSFLGLVENAAHPKLDHYFLKYFSVGGGYYCWVSGNSRLRALVDGWRKEIKDKQQKEKNNKRQNP